MTEFEDFYRKLVRTASSNRKRWLLDHRPTSVPSALWWFGLIDAAVSDVRHEQQGWPSNRPRADTALAASLIDWALEENFPIEHAINNLIQLTMLALASGRRTDLLPANAQPNNVARQALTRFGFTRAQAIARAADLRSKPISDDDYVQPGEDFAERLRLLSLTDDYKDYHRILGIHRMLDDLKPIGHLITDPELATDLAAWLEIMPELDPVPVDTAGSPPIDPGPACTGHGTNPNATS